jgi:hypothetical protein
MRPNLIAFPRATVALISKLPAPISALALKRRRLSRLLVTGAEDMPAAAVAVVDPELRISTPSPPRNTRVEMLLAKCPVQLAGGCPGNDA